MRHTAEHNLVKLTSITYFILLLSSFVPLSAAMSVNSSVHIRTIQPVTTISLSHDSVNLLAEEIISNQVIPGEMATHSYVSTFSPSSTLSYSAHLNERKMNLVASTTGEPIIVELISLADPIVKKIALLGFEEAILFEEINNSYNSYSIHYLLSSTQDIPQETEVSFSLQPEI